YYFAKDVPSTGPADPVSNCVGNADPAQSCLAFWPVFHATDVVVEGLNRNDVGEFMRPDGIAQTTYKGFPLYHFVGDTAAGDLKGEASTGGGPKTPIWFVLRNPAYTELVLSKTTEDADYLVDATGRSLYFFSQDTVGTATAAPVSKCDATCEASFTPYLSTDSPTVPSVFDPAAFTVFTRADNRKQSAYNGHPLYLHVGDHAPGQ